MICIDDSRKKTEYIKIKKQMIVEEVERLETDAINNHTNNSTIKGLHLLEMRNCVKELEYIKPILRKLESDLNAIDLYWETLRHYRG